ncbi:hypothetical protein Sjap_002605 [Stephania japonica]|uniref:Uncharacterized protein n=1 Tax=Stephania japonica TaxID=461633 RepID=A0AAP0PUA9_9MAGN
MTRQHAPPWPAPRHVDRIAGDTYTTLNTPIEQVYVEIRSRGLLQQLRPMRVTGQKSEVEELIKDGHLGEYIALQNRTGERNQRIGHAGEEDRDDFPDGKRSERRTPEIHVIKRGPTILIGPGRPYKMARLPDVSLSFTENETSTQHHPHTDAMTESESKATRPNIGGEPKATSPNIDEKSRATRLIIDEEFKAIRPNIGEKPKATSPNIDGESKATCPSTSGEPKAMSLNTGEEPKATHLKLKKQLFNLMFFSYLETEHNEVVNEAKSGSEEMVKEGRGRRRGRGGFWRKLGVAVISKDGAGQLDLLILDTLYKKLLMLDSTKDCRFNHVVFPQDFLAKSG